MNFNMKILFRFCKLGEGDYKVKLRSVKLMERMVNQNTFDEINHGK
jgi:hypothetical protein